MRGQTSVVSLAAAACFTLAAAVLHADEECSTGFAHPTADEVAALESVLRSAVEAIPAEIEGWVSGSNEDLSVASQCKDDAPRPWRYEFSRTFERVDDRAQRDRMADQAAAAYQSARQAKQPTIDEITARIEKLTMAAVAAAEGGDYAKVDEINAEIQEASDNLATAMEADGALATLDATGEEISKDRSIHISVAINPGWESLGYEARTMTPPAGASRALRWRDTRYAPTDETELVLLGSWSAADTSFDQVSRPGLEQAATQAISVSVTADETRLDSVLDMIDFPSLAALISR